MKHSPLPFKVEIDCNEDGEHDAPPIYVVSEQTLCDLTVVATIGSHSGTHEQKLATAAFIVRACNSHDALVEALEEMLSLYSTRVGTGYEHLRECDKAKAALALAKGE